VDQLKRISTLWWPQTLIGGLLIYCTIVLGYTVRQSDFSRIILHYGLWFVGYVALYNLCSAKELRFWVIFSLLLRLILVFGLPTLSDDVYRFIWDGRLWLNGINPFDHKPSFYIENGLEIPGLDLALYQQLNSPDYFTIYPPMAQLIFVIACWIFPSSILGSSVVMKLFLLAAEVGSLLLIRRLLQHFKRSPKLILLYALNPLIVIEIVGNLHFEGVMVFFLLLAYWFWIKGSWWKGAVAMALSIVSKLLPLMFLPFVIRRLGWKKSIWTFLLMGG
jgi:alpha-1,6-mannosyltransferase